jgi:molybdate transport system substrate-binding protein
LILKNKKIFFIGIFIISLIFILNIAYAAKNKILIRIMAASSLTESFNEIKNNFEAKYPNINVEINYAGSQQLATQIEQGVNADVFASANKEYMDKLASKHLVGNSKTFAHNKLILVASSNAKNIKSLNDLTKSGIKLDIASPAVPVGKYTLEMLNKIDKSGEFPFDYRQIFLKNVITQELSVKSVLTKVELGEVDAGVVYKTDLTKESLKKVKLITIDDKYNVVATYPIALIKDSKNKQPAAVFLNYVLSENGLNIFRKYGFMR